MKRIALIFIKVWSKHYEETIGDGAAQKFYEWCLERYDFDGMEKEKEKED